jgi:pyruvate ferredoxin oxidoreductase alpha subunit
MAGRGDVSRKRGRDRVLHDRFFRDQGKGRRGGLREAGWRIGLVRPRLLRPYPEAALRAALLGKRAVVVVDQNLSMGKGGVLYAELASALYRQVAAPMVLSFIGALGGRDIALEEFFAMAQAARQALKDGVSPPPRLLYTAGELREVRKLQAIAHVEREGGGE